ncbi:MAG: 2-oxo acid dehydrogenase subunit E2 [Chloroflexi bacterium]|nr:2-oxo acid dehydrogenase subunit E2 [Chloroflexota bacterium]
MTTDIIMPNLGFDSQENRLIEWLKQPGDLVQKGEPIAIIESDKANVELESIADGVLLEQLCQVDEIVGVGTVIARIGQADEAPSAPPAKTIDEAPLASPVSRGKTESPSAHLGASVLALPKVRKAAREAGIDLAVITATGPHGAITLADLQAYQDELATPLPVKPALTPPTPFPQGEGVREISLSKTRQVIGRRLSESKREAPHFYVTGEFDLERALQRLKIMPAPQPGLNNLLQYLTVQSLRRVPELNAVYENDHLYQFQTINLAIAVAREDGLITPVIKGAERYSLAELAAESRPLLQRAQANRLRGDDLHPGTFTISNLGVIGQVDQFTAVINPPQVAILAVGAIKPRPVVLDGGLHVRHTVFLTLSGDHRVVDGLHLGRFMVAFQEQLNAFNQEG